MTKKILLIIASHGFQPVEYGATREELEAADMEVITGGDKIGEAVGKDGVTKVNIEIALEDIMMDDYDGLYFIGGPGALPHLDNEESYSLLRQWEKTGKPYGAICISTRILAKAGVLQGAEATGWNEDDKLPEILKEHGASYVDRGAHTYNHITTGRDPVAAHDFGRAIVEVQNTNKKSL